jgi:hypothetical protein
MKLSELDSYFRELLPIDLWREGDYGLNGLQVGRENQEIERVAFAVDACMEVFRRAAQWKADLLFVHHGLFWGKMAPVTGPLLNRLRFLLTTSASTQSIFPSISIRSSGTTPAWCGCSASRMCGPSVYSGGGRSGIKGGSRNP